MKKFVLPFFVLLLLSLSGTAKAQSSPPCPTGDTCGGSVTFTVTFQAPGTPASVSPNSAVAGSAQATLTITAASGSTFNSTMVVQWCQQTPTPCTTSTALTTTFVSATTLTATLPAAQIANSGTFFIYIAQPSGGHADNVGPIEILAISDAPVCLTCTPMGAEVLQTVDLVSAQKS